MQYAVPALLSHPSFSMITCLQDILGTALDLELPFWDTENINTSFVIIFTFPSHD